MRSLCLAVLLATAPALAEDAGKPVRESLNSGPVTGVDSHMVLASRLSAPANFIAPYHHHPVEEFLYILEGEALVRFKDGEDVPVKAGDFYVIPAGRVHTAVTGEKEMKALIFRVHPNGKPVAIPFKGDK